MRAQPLDLDQTGPPPLDEPSAISDLADAQRARIDQMPGDPANSTDPGVRAEYELRALITRLLEANPTANPERVLAARTMTRAGLPEAIGQLAPEPSPRGKPATPPTDIDAVLLFLAGDLERIQPGSLESSEDLDRALRDAFARLVDHLASSGQVSLDPASTGWVRAPAAEAPPEPAALSDAIERWADADAPLSDRATEALRTLNNQLDAVHDLRSYRRAAARQRRLILDAGSLLELNADILDARSRQSLAQALSAALVALADPDDAQTDPRRARAELAALGNLAHLIRLADGIGDRALARALRPPLVRAIESGALADLDLNASLRALRLAGRLAEAPGEQALARQLRPAHRAILARARRTQELVLDAIPQLIDDPRRLSGVSAISAHRRELRTLDRLATLSRVIATPPGPDREPRVTTPHERLARTALAIGRRLADDPTSNSAHRALRLLLDGAARMSPSPAERALREAAPDSDAFDRWNALLDGRREEVLTLLDRVRERWRRVWADENLAAERPQVTYRLETLTRLLDTLNGLRRARRSLQQDRRTALDAWPGFELSAAARRALIQPAAEAAPELASRAPAGRAGSFEQDLDDFEQRHAAALLIGALERRAAELGLESPQSPLEAIFELGLGAPDPETARLASARADLAALCLYAEEAARAGERTGAGARDRLIAHTNRLARNLRARLDTE